MSRKGYGPNVVCYNTLIRWYCKNKEVNEVLNLYQENILEGIKPNVIINDNLLTCIFIDGLCKSGCVSEEVEMFHTLVNNIDFGIFKSLKNK